MLDATNTISKSGTPAAPIRLQAVGGRYAAGARLLRPGVRLLEPRPQRHRRLLDLRGFEIQNAGDNCIARQRLAQHRSTCCVIHGCGDTGLQITASSSDATDDAKAANNLVLNCDSYENLDQPTNGENADGFAAKLRIGPGQRVPRLPRLEQRRRRLGLLRLRRRRHHRELLGVPERQGRVGHQHRRRRQRLQAGRRAEPAPAKVARSTSSRSSYAFDNRTCGFVRNNNPEVPMLTSCGASGNGTAFCQVTSSPQVTSA